VGGKLIRGRATIKLNNVTAADIPDMKPSSIRRGQPPEGMRCDPRRPTNGSDQVRIAAANQQP
jgi:hypothetical protein